MNERLDFIEAAAELQRVYDAYYQAEIDLSSASMAGQSEAAAVQAELEREREADRVRIVELEALTADLPREKLRRLKEELDFETERQASERRLYGTVYGAQNRKRLLEQSIDELKDAKLEPYTPEEYELTHLRGKEYKPTGEQRERLRRCSSAIIDAQRSVDIALHDMAPAAEHMYKLAERAHYLLSADSRELRRQRVKESKEAVQYHLNKL